MINSFSEFISTVFVQIKKNRKSCTAKLDQFEIFLIGNKSIESKLTQHHDDEVLNGRDV